MEDLKQENESLKSDLGDKYLEIIFNDKIFLNFSSKLAKKIELNF